MTTAALAATGGTALLGQSTPAMAATSSVSAAATTSYAPFNQGPKSGSLWAALPGSDTATTNGFHIGAGTFRLTFNVVFHGYFENEPDAHFWCVTRSSNTSTTGIHGHGFIVGYFGESPRCAFLESWAHRDTSHPEYPWFMPDGASAYVSRDSRSQPLQSGTQYRFNFYSTADHAGQMWVRLVITQLVKVPAADGVTMTDAYAPFHDTGPRMDFNPFLNYMATVKDEFGLPVGFGRQIGFGNAFTHQKPVNNPGTWSIQLTNITGAGMSAHI